MQRERFIKYIDENRGHWTADTITRYISVLLTVPDEIEDWDLGQFHTWISNHHWGNNMQYTVSVIIRGYCRWRFGTGHPGSQVKVRRKRTGPQRALTLDKLNKLICSFDTMTPKGIRDLAIAALLVDTGLRSAEICRLDIGHLDLDRCKLAVITKGGNWGEAVFSEWTAQYLNSWLSIRKTSCKNVFVSLGGKTRGQPITRTGLDMIMRDWAKAIGIGHLSPHDFRRTFATISTRMGAPARVLQVAGRWSDISMVERYTSTIEKEDFMPYFPMKAVMTH